MIKVCVLCGAPFEHNPEPLAAGRCCDWYNTHHVVPFRMRKLALEAADEVIEALREIGGQ